MFQSDVAYDRFMGRFSQGLAPLFADFAGVVAGQRVLDVGAGTGALTAELLARSTEVAAAEPSAPFVDALKSRYPGVDARAAAAEQLPWPDESFDAALAQLVVAFMADQLAGAREMRRVVREGGTVAMCTWDRQGMEMLAAVDRTRIALGDEPEGASAYRNREDVESLLGPGAEAELLEVEGAYADFEDFWSALLGGVGPAGVWATSLDDERRIVARTELYRQLGEPEGPFTMIGRAWAVRVRRG
jgi:SAM-dependent methyltransferase